MVIQSLFVITLVIGVFYLIMTSLNKGALEFVEANKSTKQKLKVDESKTQKIEVKESKVKKDKAKTIKKLSNELEEIKKKSEALSQVMMKLGEAAYKDLPDEDNSPPEEDKSKNLKRDQKDTNEPDAKRLKLVIDDDDDENI